MAFYAEERGFDGRWRPVRYSAEPQDAKPEGGKVKRRVCRKVHRGHERLSLTELFEAYSPDGRFYALNRERV